MLFPAVPGPGRGSAFSRLLGWGGRGLGSPPDGLSTLLAWVALQLVDLSVAGLFTWQLAPERVDAANLLNPGLRPPRMSFLLHSDRDRS